MSTPGQSGAKKPRLSDKSHRGAGPDYGGATVIRGGAASTILRETRVSRAALPRRGQRPHCRESIVFLAQYRTHGSELPWVPMESS